MMKLPFFPFLLLFHMLVSPGHVLAQAPGIVFPGKEWEALPNTDPCDYLNGLRSFVRDSMHTTGLMVIKGGKVAMTFGDVEEVSYIASARKSILNMLYGKYVTNGTIDLNTTIGELGITDVQGLLPIEQTATVGHLLTARSGVYHPASNEGSDPNMPERGSKTPGAYFVYNNWDFNVAGTILEQATQKSIYELFQTDLAGPIGMQDYDVSRQQKFGNAALSIHPAAHFYLSARDMARLGYLMLRNGNWNGVQLIPASWISMSTAPVSATSVQHSRFNRYGYMWWIAGENTDAALEGAYTAAGAYGQFITVIPKLDMVVAHKTKASYERHTGNYEQFLMMIVEGEKGGAAAAVDPRDYIGTYAFNLQGETIQFSIQMINGALLLKGDESFPFEFDLNLCDRKTGVFLFRQMNNEVIKISFTTDAQNRITGCNFMGDPFEKVE